MSREEFLKNLPLVRATGVDSCFEIGGVKVGGGSPVIIAGPCAVESEEQLLRIAEFVKASGAHGLRGGVYKPRSSPYSFQGLGRSGLGYLAEAKAKTGLFTVVEVTSIAQIEEVTYYADLIQIGARNMQNFELLKAAGKCTQPVLLKRGLSATIQELLQAAEYILKEGNPRVILCERGIRTFETMTRNTLDINAIPLLKQLTHLPVFADPSHGTGRSDLVIPVAKAALSAGADGLIIEVHPDPATALSDGIQSLDFSGFQSLMKHLSLNQPPTEKLSKASVLPDLGRYQELAEAGYGYIPVYSELFNDAETPVTTFAKLTEGEGRFLLESVERGEQVGRYSFIGWNPLLTIKVSGAELYLIDKDGSSLIKGEPMMEIKKKLDSLQVAPMPELGTFYGGAVGFTGYDYVRQIENLPSQTESLTDLVDIYWIVPKYMARFDHVTHKITLIVLSRVEPDNLKASYLNSAQELKEILARFNQEIRLKPIPSGAQPEKDLPRELTLSKTEFMERVERIKEYIYAGDAYQVVLSQRIIQDYSGDPFMFYRLLRTINPSPYLFYLDFGAFQLAGSSPEVMVRLEDGVVTLKPIAGTKPRGGSASEDERLRQELLADEKERAEHVMLVDLGRNDLGRVCKFGSVQVKELMTVEFYSHVMHIVSTVQGQLLPDYSGIELLRAVFPAGTLSGAPKIRAMEIIEELEPTRREFYG
ncbi:MAG TPA: 3-deoxy-7-phosphoheptulonate synthase, partial [Bacillota bacterium]|nr:3-deoxy-7-phosphoheptulonate synthase [Bacillota bacterium]